MSEDDAASAAELAYQHKGHAAPVFKPMFGQSHQQYLSPKWLADAMLQIAEHAFGLHTMLPDDRPRLNAVDPTAGTGRLLIPFHKAGHNVLAVELDARLAEIAGQALGKRSVRQGDIMAYGSLIPQGRYHVMASNPPYSLWWPTPEGSPYREYELRTGEHIESQHMILELAHHLLCYQNGLLIAVLSGKLFDNNPKAAAYLNKHFQVVANLTLDRPFKPEYGIDVDASFVVAIADSPYATKQRPPLTGSFDGDGPALVAAVNAAFDQIRRNTYYNPRFAMGPGNRPVNYLSAGWSKIAPDVPDLDNLVRVDTTSLPIRVTARGVAPTSDWAAAWLRFYNTTPIQTYDAAQGTFAPLGEAYGSLPNVLMAGVGPTKEALEGLGFDVSLTDHDASQLAIRARRYGRDRLPIRDLEPMEYLAHFPDGPITAKATVTLGNGVVIPEGATYDLRSRWFRREEEVGAGEQKGEGKKRYTQHTFVDRGYLILRLTPADPTLQPLTVEEINPDQVKALVDAFGLPQVPTVEDLPDLKGWERKLERFMDAHARAAGGRRLYPTQAGDVARMACKSTVALLYEPGAGKTTTMAHWATVRGYRSVLIVTPASVVPGIVEDLTAWGFPAIRLDNYVVNNILERKRRHRAARQRVRTARQRIGKLQDRIIAETPYPGRPAPDDAGERIARIYQRKAVEDDILDAERSRVDLEAQLAAKHRHLHNLQAVKRKGKARSREIDAEIGLAAQQVEALAKRVGLCYDALRDPRPEICDTPQFYVASYQDLSLGDHDGLFDPWDHDHYSRQGDYEGTVSGNRGARCSACDAARRATVVKCPKCGVPWRGQNDGGGRFCRACGHRAWTMGRSAKRPLPDVDRGLPRREQIALRKQRIELMKEHQLDARAGDQAGDDVLVSTNHTWPLANRFAAIFSCVMLDESQEAKSKLSLRGTAARRLRARGRAILTGTWIKGYIHDLFWTAGWLLGYGSPLWPFPYYGGSARFLNQFATYQFVTREYADTLEVGKRKLIPSVSNLNRLWKLLSPVSIRRLKADFLTALPEKHRHVHWIQPTGKHELLVSKVTTEMKDVLARELRKANPDMGTISAALWWGRYVASCPNEYGALHFAGAWGHRINVDEATPEEARAILEQMKAEGAYMTPPAGHRVAYAFEKVLKTIKILDQVKAAGEKAIVFTSLRGLYRTLEYALTCHCIPYLGMDGVSTAKRNDVIRRFEASSATVLLAGTGTLNRGVTVNGANHVVILNLEWSPEVTLQAEDRCHRPGQTREVHVHYILSDLTVDQQMYDLIMAKWAAQRAVQDREAQSRSVEAILEEAALANAQLAVAKAVLTDLKLPANATPEQKVEAEKQAQEIRREITDKLIFGRMPAELRQVKRRQSRTEIKVLYFRGLFEAAEEDPKAILLPAGQPVQLAMFAV